MNHKIQWRVLQLISAQWVFCPFSRGVLHVVRTRDCRV